MAETLVPKGRQSTLPPLQGWDYHTAFSRGFASLHHLPVILSGLRPYSRNLNKLVEQLQKLQEKKWKRWTEIFEDEDTHEMVDIERKELLTTETSDEERELWMQIIPELPKLSDEELRNLQSLLLSTDLDDTPIVEVQAERGDVDALSDGQWRHTLSCLP